MTIIDSPAVANLMNPQRFNQMMMIAQTMASASLIPEHLLGRKKGGTMEWFTADEVRANCFLVVNQAFRWEMDPFAVAAETYVVGGKLGFQGKLVKAAVMSLAGVELRQAFNSKQGPDLAIVVYSTPNNRDVTESERIKIAAYAETEDRVAMSELEFSGIKAVRVSVAQAKTDNSMWTKDPEQKLGYTGATKWARRHKPQIILGVQTDDDLDSMDMREARGHVVEPTTTKVITGSDSTPQPAAAKPAPAKAPKGAKAAPKAQEAEPEADMPERMDMVNDLRDAYQAAGVKTGPEAEAVMREHGLLPVGVGVGGLKDVKQLFAIWVRREELFPPMAPQAIHAFYKSHTVRRSPDDSEKKWTCWQLQYEEAGGDGTVKDAVTFSSTFGKILDGLEGEEAILLTVKSGEKGDSIQTLALAPAEGRAEA
jgi:hypothetical protein